VVNMDGCDRFKSYSRVKNATFKGYGNVMNMAALYLQ
jgi:hypothetical protein